MDPGPRSWHLLVVVFELIELFIGLQIDFVLLIELDFEGNDVGDVSQDRSVNERLKLSA